MFELTMFKLTMFKLTIARARPIDSSKLGGPKPQPIVTKAEIDVLRASP